jgi:hypothetical protein
VSETPSDEVERDLAALRELAERSEAMEPAQFAVKPWVAWLLLASIQLTVSHPELGPEMKRQLTELGQQIQALFGGRLAVPYAR